MRRLLSLSIRYKLALAFGCSALVALALVLVALGQFNQAIPPLAITTLHQLVQDRADDFDSTATEMSTIIDQVTQDQLNLVSYGALNLNAQSAAERTQLETAFRVVQTTVPNLHQLRFVSLTGQTIVSVPSTTATDETSQDYYLALSQRLPTRAGAAVYLSPIHLQPVASIDFVAIPVVQTHPLGYVVAQVDLINPVDPNIPSFYEDLSSVATDAGPINFYLVRPDGEVLSPDNTQVTPSDATRTSIKALLASNNIPFQYTSPLTGSQALGTSVAIPQLSVSIVAEIDTSQLVQSGRNAPYILPIVGLLALGLALIAIFAVLTDTQIVRPIHTISEFVSHLAQGRFPEPPKESMPNDELGSLLTTTLAIARRLQTDSQLLKEDAVQTANRTSAYRRMSRELFGLRDLESLCRSVVALLREQMATLAMIQIYLVDSAHREIALYLTATKGEAPRVVGGVKLPLDMETTVGKAAISRELVLVRQGIEVEQPLPPEIVVQLELPVIDDTTLLAVIDLRSQSNTAFSESEISALQSLADEFAVALHNVQVLEDLETQLESLTVLNRQLSGEAWKQYATLRRGNLPSASTETQRSVEWSDIQQAAIASGDIVEQTSGDVVRFAIPLSLRGQILGAVEWTIPADRYNENTRLLAQELTTRLAISADNARLFEQAQRLAQRERLVNEIAGKLVQQTDVAEVLKVAAREVGLALQVPQTSIRLATVANQPLLETDSLLDKD